MPNAPPVADARLGSARLLLELAHGNGAGAGALREAIILQLALAYRLLLVELAAAGGGWRGALGSDTNELRNALPTLLAAQLGRLEQSGWLAQLLRAEAALAMTVAPTGSLPPLAHCQHWHSSLVELSGGLRAEFAEC